MGWWLEVLESPRLPPGIRFRIGDGCLWTFGRDKSSMESHIRIPEAAVSREHAILECSAGGPTITDCGSLSGTFVNGFRISQQRCRSQPIILEDSSVIEIGSTSFCVKNTQ